MQTLYPSPGFPNHRRPELSPLNTPSLAVAQLCALGFATTQTISSVSSPCCSSCSQGSSNESGSTPCSSDLKHTCLEGFNTKCLEKSCLIGRIYFVWIELCIWTLVCHELFLPACICFWYSQLVICDRSPKVSLQKKMVLMQSNQMWFSWTGAIHVMDASISDSSGILI